MVNIKEYIKNSIYYVASLDILKNLMRPFKGRAALLCYHRVVNDSVFFNEKSPQKNLLVTIENFNSHLNYLSSNHEVISMAEMVNHLNSDSDEFKVAITFDDGYKDNLDNALPILEKYNLPAIIYVTTRFPEGDCTMWWYELWEIIKNKESIAFEFKEKKYLLNCKSNSQKIKIYNLLSKFIVYENLETQKSLLKLIKEENNLINYKSICLSWDEIIVLAKHPLITIGSHTYNHNSLKNISEKESYWELEYSKKLIENVINKPVDHLAYPYGTKNDVSLREHKYSKDCGYISAVETGMNKINNSSSMFSLPRVPIRNTNHFIIGGQLSGIGNLFSNL